MVEKKQEAQQENEVTLTDVVTQTDVAFKLPDGRVLGTQEYLAWLGNLVYKLSKSLI